MYRVADVRILIEAHGLAKQGKSIKTGMWDTPYFTPEQFENWFRDCLNAKINRTDTRKFRKFGTEYQWDLMKDSRIINDSASRIVRSGCNILNTPEMKKRYPHINTNWGE